MELGERRRRILAAVVNDYVRPATIRNELAAISEMGYLRQPHTSAGRVPSDLGYRYYVDRLMPDPALELAESSRAKRSYDAYESEVESILQRTCRILSDLTSYTSLATTPQMDGISIKHVALSAVALGKILAITMLNTGQINHRLLDYPEKLLSTDLVAIGNLINARFQGADLGNFAARSDEELPPELLRLKGLYKRVTTVLKQALVSAAGDEIYMDGTSHILKQPEFARTERATWILDVLEHRKTLFQILSSALLGEDVAVIIGSENQFEEMRECSFIASSYSVGLRVCGSIGVVGPTRMDYRRAVAAVRFMASNLSQLLTWLSVG